MAQDGKVVTTRLSPATEQLVEKYRSQHLLTTSKAVNELLWYALQGEDVMELRGKITKKLRAEERKGAAR